MLGITMFIVNKKKKEVFPLTKRTFKKEDLEERGDLQEWIANRPNIFGEPLLIIQKEFSGWDKTNERLDLLALDKNKRLVIIENKIDDSGKDVVGQAIKYGAHCSTLTTSQIISIYQKYLNKHDKGNAEEKISEFFNDADVEELVLNPDGNPRLILVAGEFPPEVTSTALWLIKNNINVQCFKVALFSLKKELLLNVSKIIPPPNAENYMVGLAEKNIEEKQTAKTVSANEERCLKFWRQALDVFKEQQINAFEDGNAYGKNLLARGAGIARCRYHLYFQKEAIRIGLYIDRGSKKENKDIYDSIYKEKETLEKKLGYELNWDSDDNKKASVISYRKEINSYDEKNWDDMIKWFAEHFQKFEKNMQPIIARHPLHK